MLSACCLLQGTEAKMQVSTLDGMVCTYERKGTALSLGIPPIKLLAGGQALTRFSASNSLM